MKKRSEWLMLEERCGHILLSSLRSRRADGSLGSTSSLRNWDEIFGRMCTRKCDGMNGRALATPGMQMVRYAWILQDAEVPPPAGWRRCRAGSTRLAGMSKGGVWGKGVGWAGARQPGIGAGHGWGEGGWQEQDLGSVGRGAT
jgi:hypothetical protein